MYVFRPNPKCGSRPNIGTLTGVLSTVDVLENSLFLNKCMSYSDHLQ